MICTLTWDVSIRMANLWNRGKDRESQKRGEAKENNRVEAYPDCVHLCYLVMVMVNWLLTVKQASANDGSLLARFRLLLASLPSCVFVCTGSVAYRTYRPVAGSCRKKRKGKGGQEGTRCNYDEGIIQFEVWRLFEVWNFEFKFKIQKLLLREFSIHKLKSRCTS